MPTRQRAWASATIRANLASQCTGSSCNRVRRDERPFSNLPIQMINEATLVSSRTRLVSGFCSHSFQHVGTVTFLHLVAPLETDYFSIRGVRDLLLFFAARMSQPHSFSTTDKISRTLSGSIRRGTSIFARPDDCRRLAGRLRKYHDAGLFVLVFWDGRRFTTGARISAFTLSLPSQRTRARRRSLKN